jgi:hypothetical protein
MTYLTEEERFLAVTVSKTKYSAREIRDLDFNIDLKYVMGLLKKQKGKCALTGWQLEFVRSGSKFDKNPLVCTMDRINNTKGYVRGNIQLTCWLPNRIKNNFWFSHFFNFRIRRVDISTFNQRKLKLLISRLLQLF